jgi:hypothetical protein
MPACTDPTRERMHVLYRDEFATAIRRQEERLRDLADQLDRYASDVYSVPTPGRPNYVTIAVSVQHDVLWGLANLNLDNLTTRAAEADALRPTPYGRRPPPQGEQS